MENSPNKKFSGKFVVRLPVSLLENLKLEAVKEGVNLNQLVVCKLSLTLGISAERKLENRTKHRSNLN